MKKSLHTLLVAVVFSVNSYAQMPPSMMPPQGMEQSMPRPPQGGVREALCGKILVGQ
jgi:hypothetical protein